MDSNRRVGTALKISEILWIGVLFKIGSIATKEFTKELIDNFVAWINESLGQFIELCAKYFICLPTNSMLRNARSVVSTFYMVASRQDNRAIATE